jgi:hypothetical protein
VLKKSSILFALLLAAAYSRPIFADEFGTVSPVKWVAGSGELLEMMSAPVFCLVMF